MIFKGKQGLFISVHVNARVNMCLEVLSSACLWPTSVLATMYSAHSDPTYTQIGVTPENFTTGNGLMIAEIHALVFKTRKEDLREGIQRLGQVISVLLNGIDPSTRG